MQKVSNVTKKNQSQQKGKRFTLIDGEKLFHNDKCNIKIDKKLIPCKVLITNYRVYILPDLKRSQ